MAEKVGDPTIEILAMMLWRDREDEFNRASASGGVSIPWLSLDQVDRDRWRKYASGSEPLPDPVEF